MNRRQFFTAAPAILAAPIVPKPEEHKPLAGVIAVFDGKKYRPISSLFAKNNYERCPKL